MKPRQNNQPSRQQRKLNAALFDAIDDGDLTRVKTLLDEGADLEAREFDGETPLIHACEHLDIVQYLLSRGAAINAQAKYGDTALTGPAECGWLAVMQVLLDHGIALDLQERDGTTALMRASHSGQVEAARLLLAHGAEIDLQNRRGQTALDIAIEQGQVAVADLLVKQGARYPKGAAAARKAARYQRDGRAMLAAAEKGQLAQVRRWLDRGIAPDFAGDRAETALLNAVGFGHLKVVQLLLERGASPNPPKGAKASPLTEAAHFGSIAFAHRVAIVQALLDAGADPNFKDSLGNTALRHLLSSDRTQHMLDAVRALLDAGANPNLPDREGETLLDFTQASLAWLDEEEDEEADAEAEQERQQERAVLTTIEQLLLSYGARATAADTRSPQEQLQETVFGASELPAPLQSLFDLEAELQTKGLSLDVLEFELLGKPLDSGIRPPGSLPFAYTGFNGTHFAFLSSSKRRPDFTQVPIVMYGDEIDPQARVIAADFHSFLCLLLTVRSADVIEQLEYVLNAVEEQEANLKSDPQVWRAVQKVSRALKERFQLTKLRDSVAAVARCRAQYPEIELWNLDEAE